MGLETVTQSKIDKLIGMPKRVTNSNSRTKEKLSHKQKNYKVISTEDADFSFSLFVRQNNLLDDDFSCGLIWNAPSGDTLILKRYNGASHAHKNNLEGEQLKATYHIHTAKENYLKAGKKAEGYAEETGRYKTAEGALHCLLLDCSISGLTSQEDIPSLFDEN